MPYYDYKCTNGHIFESFSFIKNRNIPKLCPNCKYKNVGKHIITKPNMIMKTKPGEQNIIDSSPMSHVNDGLPNDL